MRLLAFVLCLLAVQANAQPLWRNFFTTNQNPRVTVVAGSNSTVQASTVGTDQRIFTINSVPNPAGITNGDTRNLQFFGGVTNNSPAGFVGNGVGLTNVPFAFWTNYTSNPNDFTNLNGLAYGSGMYGMTSYWGYATAPGVGPIGIFYNGIDTNTVITTNGGSFYGAILDLSGTATAPSSNQLVTASWVRNLFNVGAAYYNSTNIDSGATNADSTSQYVYKYQSTIPISDVRSYTTANFLTNSGYVGAVVTTNTFPSLGGTIVISAYFGFTGGNPTPTLSIKPEIYISSDKTNWYNEVAATPQNITWNSTNLYQWLLDFPNTTATNASGFYVQHRFKVVSTTGTGTARNLFVFVGTNAISGTADAAHLTMQSPTATAGNAYLANNQVFTGSNSFLKPIALLGIPIAQINTNGTSWWPYKAYNLIYGDGGTLLTTNTPWPTDPLVTGADAQSNYVGQANAFFGFNAGSSNSSGFGNAFFGCRAGISNTIGDQNAFFGWYAGDGNIDGYHNTFLGAFAGNSFTNGNYNTAVGTDSAANGQANGSGNTFVGSMAGGSYLNGSNNVCVGLSAGRNLVQGQPNTFIGASAGYNNSNGNHNVAIGYIALNANVSGHYNVAIGNDALNKEKNSSNTGIGYYSLASTTNSQGNTGLGYYSGLNALSSSGCTFIGYNSGDGPGTSSYSTALGYGSTVSSNRQIMLGTSAECVVMPRDALVTNNIVVGGSVTATNITLTDTLVANLGTPAANTYPMRYASDVLTSQGVGGFVKWNGSGWVTLENIVATSNATNWMFGCWQAGANFDTPTSWMRNNIRPPVVTTVLGWSPATSGAGSVGGIASSGGSTAYGSAVKMSGGTTSGGYTIGPGHMFQWNKGTTDMACFGVVTFVDVAANANNQYWISAGITSSGTTVKWPTTGAWFGYNMYTNFVVIGGTPTDTYTNNWICCVAQASSYTYLDSGLAVSTSSSTPNRLAIVLGSTGILFYTNGVLSQTVTANIPNANQLFTGSYCVSNTLYASGQANQYLQNSFYGTRNAAMTIP